MMDNECELRSYEQWHLGKTPGVVSPNLIFLIPQPPPRFFSNFYNPTFTLSLFIQPRHEKNTEHWVFPITNEELRWTHEIS